MQTLTKKWYERALHDSHKTNGVLFGICVACLFVIFFGGALYLALANDTQPIPKTCASFASYAELQTWLVKHPEDFARLNNYGRGKYPTIACDSLYEASTTPAI